MKNPSQALPPLIKIYDIHTCIQIHIRSSLAIKCMKSYPAYAVAAVFISRVSVFALCISVPAKHAILFSGWLDWRMLSCIHSADITVSRAALFLVLQRGKRDATVVYS
jgi:hypothetical protein